jgi:hypothetical protein
MVLYGILGIVLVAGCIMKCIRRYGGLSTVLTMGRHSQVAVSGHISHGTQYIRVRETAR